MCIDSCGDGMVYNTSSKKCVSTTVKFALSFVPLPYCIAAIVLMIPIIILYYVKNVHIFASVFATIGSIQMCAVITIFVIIAIDINN
jgi:hypothetical protein